MLRCILTAFAALSLIAPATAQQPAQDFRFSATPGNVPGVNDNRPLNNNTLGLNRADGRLFWRRPDGSLGTSTLLDALPSGRKAVEQGNADDLTVVPSGSAPPGTLSRVIADRAPLAGPMFSGTAGAGSFSAYATGQDVTSSVEADAGKAAYLRLKQAGKPVFDLGKDGNRNLYLGYFDDNGTYVANALTANRTTGVVSFPKSPVVPTPPVTDVSQAVATTDYVRSVQRDYEALMGIGYFDVWLDGVSFTNPAPGSFAATLFRILYDGNPGTFTVAQQGGPYSLGAGNALRWNQTVASTNSTYRSIEARIEDGSTFNGTKATLSFYASAAAANTPLTVIVQQFFGSGGSPSAPVNVVSQNISLTTSPKLYTITVDMPVTNAKFYGNNIDDCVKLQFYLPAQSVFDVTFSQMRFERGGYMSAFSQVPLSLKHQHLERYIQYSRFSIGGSATVAGQYIYGNIPFKTEMRAPSTGGPTITFFTGSQRGNLGGAGAPVVTSSTVYGASAYIQSGGAGAFFAVDETVRLDKRL